ncbi:hypothetical protein C2W62_32225 [Candidatus Entotheonella serta]|nr:hypothetical protein C2W62_32225 [Candidatus Entotheonella serta]
MLLLKSEATTAMSVCASFATSGPTRPSVYRGSFTTTKPCRLHRDRYRQAGPPIWVGGNSARSRRRVAELGDGWHASSLLASEMAPGCEHVRELWGKNNRQGEPVFSCRIALSLDGISQEVTSYASRQPRSRITGSIESAVEQFAAY